MQLFFFSLGLVRERKLAVVLVSYLVGFVPCQRLWTQVCSHSLGLDWTQCSFLGKEKQHGHNRVFISAGATNDAVICLPGLLSFSSLSSRLPETPLSLDWSCTFILSLLLIRHTELLEHMKCRQVLARPTGHFCTKLTFFPLVFRFSTCSDEPALTVQMFLTGIHMTKWCQTNTNLRRLFCVFAVVEPCWFCLSNMDCSLRHWEGQGVADL